MPADLGLEGLFLPARGRHLELLQGASGRDHRAPFYLGSHFLKRGEAVCVAMGGVGERPFSSRSFSLGT